MLQRGYLIFECFSGEHESKEWSVQKLYPSEVEARKAAMATTRRPHFGDATFRGFEIRLAIWDPEDDQYFQAIEPLGQWWPFIDWIHCAGYKAEQEKLKALGA